MANFGELVLIVGDFHIPARASKIPAPFKRMLVPNKMQHVICTGNLSQEQYEEVMQLAPNVHITAGDFDTVQSVTFPETRVLQVGSFRIGVVHGHQILPWNSEEAVARMRRKLNVDVLVSGHTHQNQVSVQDDTFYHINPGSITGAYSSLTDTVTPSFVLLAVQDTKLVCYVYELVKGEVEVSKTEFTKKVPETASPALLESLLK
jgi:vacuolar protein sorting-associated protein 29